jgi:ATP-dependent helicase HepA
VADTEYALLRDGWFVEVDGDDRRLGKLIKQDGSNLEVEFFHSASKSDAIAFASTDVSRTYLARETRVYFRLSEDSRWRMGRVRDYFFEDDGSVTYEVKCPNGDLRDIPEQFLRARCYAVHGDPAEVLAIGAGETQRWHDARWAAQETLINLRSAANGLTGLISASVELVPHQVDAVRRVLCDPLQRYLLADEVGHGKTIEAGAVVRQVLLDDPTRKVLVVVTEPLLAQWERELHDKFASQRGPNIDIVTHDQLPNCTAKPDLLIVDEAHRVSEGTAAHDAISRLSALCPRVLLLSATPLIGHEAAFLSILRWLDPDRWGQESVENFRRHVEQSQEYGRLLLGLRDDASTFLLRQRAQGAKATFTDDLKVEALSNQLLSNLDDEQERKRICGELREHIADSYRIHHRIVRSRRSDLEGWEFQERGPAVVREEADDDSGLERASAVIEDWRGSALLALEDDPALEIALIDRFALLLETVGQGNAALSKLAPLKPLFAAEGELLDGLRACAGLGSDATRADLIALIAERQLRFLRQSVAAPKLVIFATETEFCEAIKDALIARLGADAVIALGAAHQGDELMRFEFDTKTSVALLDERGEEGLNLHFADAVLHADLPFSLGRIEQRIGRLDRFGRTKGPLKHAVVIPDGNEDTPWSLWLETLKSGVKIFDQPVSDLQFVIERVEQSIRRHLFLEGANGLEDYFLSLQELMATERQRLDEQYALDQLAMSSESARALVDSMEAAEEDEGDLADRLERLLGHLLNFRIARTNDEFQLAWAQNTLLPERPWKPLFDEALKRPLTWKRRVAIARPNVDLMRPGAPLVDALERLLEWDDRGSAFATWRFRRGNGGPGEEGLFFRLCWVITPGNLTDTNLLQTEDVAGLRRRASSFLRPWTLVQHVGADVSVIHDRAILQLLQQPFQPGEDDDGRDFNLGSRPEWLASVAGPSEFSDLCVRIREFGREALEASEDLQERLSAAARGAEREIERRRQRLEARAARGDKSALRDRQLDLAVLQSVKSPEVRLDCVGAFVLAGHIPRGSRS